MKKMPTYISFHININDLIIAQVRKIFQTAFLQLQVGLIYLIR